MKSDDKLSKAIEVVNQAIAQERNRLQKIADTDEASPIVVEGTTRAYYDCQLMADPKEVAQVMLKHDYPVWNVLGEDAPTAMWDELASIFGLESVSSVDL